MSLVYKLLAVLFAGAFFASQSFAAPRAQSAEECSIAADRALVAQSRAREDIHRPKAGAIMDRIYDDVAQSERGTELMKAILDTAYTRNAALGETGGDMDAILGRRL